MADPVTSLLGNPAFTTGLGILSANSRGGTISQGIAEGLALQRAQLLNELRRREIARVILAQQQQQNLNAGREQVRTTLADPNLTRQQIISQVGQAPGFEATALDARLAQTGPGIGNVNPSNFTPESVARFQQSGNFADLVPVEKAPLVQNIVGGGAFKVPAGFMMKNANDPSQGVVPIPGGPATRKSPEAAAKTALTAGAQQLLPQIRGQIIKNGAIDRVLVGTINANLPFTQGRVVRTQILDAIEAKLRAESGAAVPQTEVERAAIRFMPSTLDSDTGIEDKLDRLETFLGTALQKSDPELYQKLTSQKAEPSGKVQDSKTVGGKRFIKQNGQWFEVQ